MCLASSEFFLRPTGRSHGPSTLVLRASQRFAHMGLTERVRCHCHRLARKGRSSAITDKTSKKLFTERENICASWGSFRLLTQTSWWDDAIVDEFERQSVSADNLMDTASTVRSFLRNSPPSALWHVGLKCCDMCWRQSGSGPFFQTTYSSSHRVTHPASVTRMLHDDRHCIVHPVLPLSRHHAPPTRPTHPPTRPTTTTTDVSTQATPPHHTTPHHTHTTPHHTTQHNTTQHNTTQHNPTQPNTHTPTTHNNQATTKPTKGCLGWPA